MKILVAYATAHGSTGEVAEFLGRILRTYNVEVDVANVKSITSIDGYDAYVLGSAIHGGLWLQEMCVFTWDYKVQFAQKPCYFWVNCIRALEPDGFEYALKNYFDSHILDAIQVRSFSVFTGKLNADAITRQELWYLVSNYDGRQTPGTIKNDFRDWEAIAIWGHEIAKDLKLVPVFESIPEPVRGAASVDVN